MQLREGEVVCDVQELPPPEPMTAVLQALESLSDGHYVRMLHRMEPVPLYALLADMGYVYRLHLQGEAPYEIMIHRIGDSLAQSRIGSVCGAV